MTHALFGKMELPPSTLPTDLRHMELTILIEYQSLWNVGGEELSAWANSAPWMPRAKPGTYQAILISLCKTHSAIVLGIAKCWELILSVSNYSSKYEMEFLMWWRPLFFNLTLLTNFSHQKLCILTGSFLPHYIATATIAPLLTPSRSQKILWTDNNSSIAHFWSSYWWWWRPISCVLNTGCPRPPFLWEKDFPICISEFCIAYL